MYATIEKYIDFIIDNSTPDKPYWNVESIRQGKPPHWNYIDGCMMTALWNMYIQTGRQKYFDFVDSFVDYYVFDDGSIRGYDLSKYNLDDVNEGRVLFDLYGATGKEKYLKAINRLKSQLQGQPRTESGNFWHKKIYPNQIWLDGLYMAQVFCCRYQTAFDNCDYTDVVNQFENVRKLMFDENKGLYYHGIDCSKQMFWADKKTGLSRSFWLRSIGWFLVALADVLDFMQNKRSKEKLGKIFAEAIEGVSRYVDGDTHMLYQVVDKADKEGNYLETSGSSMVAYAMLKGARLGFCDAKYAALGKEIFDGICSRYLTSDGNGKLKLDGICLVAGLGPEDNTRRDGTFEYYISEPVVSDDAKGVAPFVLCYTEIRMLLTNA
ncbi:MAG: glycoside hydrolase family 88 protein [Corallococcus sp.]|nr:glycoside hydrolase family 88 protein [Corallococcus sp.]